MKVLTIKQPWAYLIATGIKDVENRTWKCPEKYIGQRILIHASAMPCIDIYNIFSDDQKTFIFNNAKKSAIENVRTGVDVHNACKTISSIIGSAEIVDCVVKHSSIWAEKMLTKPKWEDYHNELGGNKELFQYNLQLYKNQKTVYNWVLANPILFDEPILGVKGKLGFWNYEV